ncbi:glutathione S-transferase [Chaetoceros tenuissimus]|uniref:Glutathione S-transferase n=1 Tax=Chaetoceros tenuissimus TaxID=426638 RepID=A0AAD3H899_9STRA|nr:glutathione S-transferase [Chaetoceros tenuissimus]
MKLIVSLLFYIQLACVSAFVSAGKNEKPKCTELGMGGYDQTIINPNSSIQFFVLPGNTCPYVQRTHIALQELGLPFDITEVSGMPKPDWYLRINPRGKVPALKKDTTVIYESAICNEFLCDLANSMNTEQTLMPSDPITRAKIRLLNDHCDNVFSKTQFTYLMNKDSEKDQELKEAMEDALKMYEDTLAETRGPFLMGADFTIADLHLLPFLQRLVITLKYWKNYELPQAKFGRLSKWLDACLDRDSVKESSMSERDTIEVYKKFVEADYKFGGLNKN